MNNKHNYTIYIHCYEDVISCCFFLLLNFFETKHILMTTTITDALKILFSSSNCQWQIVVNKPHCSVIGCAICNKNFSNLHFGALWGKPCFEFCTGLQVTANNIYSGLLWKVFLTLWKSTDTQTLLCYILSKQAFSQWVGSGKG